MESELVKLNKQLDQLTIALNNLNRDETKFLSVIKVLNEELERLEENKNYLKSKAAIISLSDFVKLESKIEDLAVEVKHAQKQLDALRAFKSITEDDYSYCSSCIAKYKAILNRKAEILDFSGGDK